MKQTPDPIANPLLVAAKVAGFNDVVYGLKDTTPTQPILYLHNDQLLLFSHFSEYNFAEGRYLPEQR
ncbi:hypothetical protein NXW20_00110 [Bacteroides faecis]|nr:hypothetical protein [Bacteroides faecis]MCS2194147.1 hypothetical protein [Bacteroides faecis]